MDINEAALKLAKIEVIKSQVKHLQKEAYESTCFDYAESCNEKAQQLINSLNINSLFQ